MRIKNLKKVFLPGELASADKRQETFAELVYFIDDGSLQLVMRDAKDMKITEKKDFDCDSCTLGKQTVTHNRTADTRSNTPLEFVHSDLSGAVELPACEGFRYAINFVDDHTGSTFIYFLKFKSDARKALKKFLAYSGQFGTVKKLQSDNGSECLLTNTYRRNTNGEKD